MATKWILENKFFIDISENVAGKEMVKANLDWT